MWNGDRGGIDGWDLIATIALFLLLPIRAFWLLSEAWKESKRSKREEKK